MRKSSAFIIWLLTASTVVVAQVKNDTGGGDSSDLGILGLIIGLVVLGAGIYFYNTRSKKS